MERNKICGENVYGTNFVEENKNCVETKNVENNKNETKMKIFQF